jgi:hypothetical protein
MAQLEEGRLSVKRDLKDCGVRVSLIVPAAVEALPSRITKVSGILLWCIGLMERLLNQPRAALGLRYLERPIIRPLYAQ